MPDNGAGDSELAYKLERTKFAADLKNLHIEQGKPKLTELVRRAAGSGRRPLSAPRISEIFGGKGGLPRLDYTIELVRVLTGDNPEAQDKWRRRWMELQRLGHAAKSGRGQHDLASDTSTAELDEPQAVPQWLSDTVQSLELRAETAEARAKAAETRANDAHLLTVRLQEALYTHWPSGGVALATPRASDRDRIPTWGGGPVLSVSFHPGGRMLATGYENGALMVWDADMACVQGLSKRRADTKAVFCVAFSLTGDILAAGSADGTVRLALRGASQFTGPLTFVEDSPVAQGSAIRSVAFGPGNLLAAGNAEGAVHVWQCHPDGEARVRSDPFHEHQFGGAVRSLAFRPGRNLLAVGTDKGRDSASAADLLDFDSGYDERHDMRFYGSPVQSVAFSRNGNLLAIAEDRTVHLKSLNNRQPAGTEPLASIRCDKVIQSLAFNPTDDHLVIGAGRTCTLYRVRSSDLRRERTIKLEAAARSLAFRPDGKLLAVGREDGVVQLFGPDVCRI